uniref:Wu:fj29h11 n=1 Tax=Sphaeramia orbicularis TaxID=375764 RepID=A0A673AIR0_9TELE
MTDNIDSVSVLGFLFLLPALLKMEKVKEDIVSMVKQNPAGIPLKKLSIHYGQTYHRNLTLSALGFNSMSSLVASLNKDLVVRGEMVFHKTNLPCTTQAGAEKPTKAKKDSNKVDVLENVTAMIKEHPDGIPLNKVAIAYSQKYRHNLSLASLGFQTISGLVESLNSDLLVEGEVVFHKINKPENQCGNRTLAESTDNSGPSTPQKTESSTASTNATTSVKTSQATMSSTYVIINGLFSDLMDVVGLQWICLARVIHHYQLTAPSMQQLKTCYSQRFGGEFPLALYMSMYDSLGTSRTEPQPTALLSQNITREPEREAVQQAAASNILSDSDFPALGADMNQKSKIKAETPRESSAAIFRDAYHAQLREVHGSNVRALEALEEDTEDLTGRRRKILDHNTVNSLMEDVIRDIASEGELVTKEKVISKTCQLLQIPSLESARIKHWQIPALKDLQYVIREVNMFLESTEAVSSICTLYELGRSLAALKDKKRYEELNLGPLCKLPLVHRMFKIDSNTKDDDIHQIETVDILKQLRIFRRKQTKVKVDLAEFMKYLADHYNCESPYELGIRIHSVGLPIATLMKVSRTEHTMLEQAREVIQRELEEETQEHLRKIKKNVLEAIQVPGSFSSTPNLDLRKKYALIPAAEVVLAVLTNAEGLFNPRMTKHVQAFLLQVSSDRLAKALFQLAICGGSLAVPQDLVLKDKASKSTDQMKKEEKPTTSLPSEAVVKQYVKESLSSQSSAITLAHISSLEKKVTKQFHVKDFLSLEHGSFLEFLVKHIQVQLLQESVGSALILSSSSMELAGSGFRPTRQDVFEFIKQCGDINTSDPEQLSYIESALRSHYKVRDSRDLGFGTLQRLAGLVQQQKKLGGGGLSPVYYESALPFVHCECASVGRLGEMSKAQALASLLSCPLLEDLSEWSQWELIFKPLHGPLKDFIERNAANTGLAALEVTPGLLLRITTNTGDKYFCSAAVDLDPVGTSGHLVSIVVADGIINAPTALLANHMQTSLAAAVAREDDVSCYSTVAKFLLSCLTRIPIRTCKTLLQQVFLEPFSKVLGQAKSKHVLITVAQSDPKHMNCLHRLGILLGITDWVKDYQKKLNPPQIQNGFTAPVEAAKVTEISAPSAGMHSVIHTFCLITFTEYLYAVNGEQEVEIEEEMDEEELYELASLSNGETSDISSEAEKSQEEEQAEMPNANENDAADHQTENTLEPQRAVIEDIRKSEFGIGVELTAEGQKLMQVHQDRLGRSLDRLSTELYSKDTHFVLELIQNADDNNYPSETSVVPALAFVVTRDCITVLNNETGFQERNIRAICDVGRSTKGKHKYGYIGQKGIGFKSVFKVTDCPEIHSNGFHLYFDKNCGPMGYILPHWTEDERPLDSELKDINEHSWTTKICLPLRSESHQTRNLFHDVHPSLLLFLHRLRSITIYNQNEKRLVTMIRKDLSHNVLEVEHTDGTERWLVVKTTLKPRKIKEDVESTELALAFQLNSDFTCQPQKQPVFAYLPLRSFGFRFIVQADFDIPSSREDVDRDSSWNQWLRSEIPQLFLQAMDIFTDHPEFKGLKGLCHFLQFIPLPDEVLDFFKPVAGQIIQLFKGKAFLPTLSSDGKVVYKLPSQVAVCQDAVIRDVIGGEELERHLCLSYLHPGLNPAPPTSLLTHLGVRYLRGSDVTMVTTAMAKELMKAEGIHGLRQLARLLVCNFRALEHGYGEADSVLQTLRDLPIIPLADGRVVALNGEGVFFPMEEIKTKKKKVQAQTDVNVVHPTLLSCVEPLESQQVRELLRRLGVHELEPQELLEQHIYPTIRSNKWKSKPETVVVSYLVFIKQHSSSCQELSNAAVPVLTSRGLLCPAQERVHFSQEYGNMDLLKKLPGCDWILLSPCYVQSDGDVAGWRELFSRLGVRDGLISRKERRTLTASSPWSVESAMWHQNPEEGCVLDDYPCEEFHALATAQLPGSVLLQQRLTLLELLATNWDTGHCYSQYLTAQVIDSDGRQIKSTRSSFYYFLCRLEWLPAYRPTENGQQERMYLCPSLVYLASPEVSSLLGSHVSYVDIDPSEFSRALGMRNTITVEVLINYLKEWCIKPETDDQESENESQGAEFTSTVEHIHNVYTYLHKNCSHGSLKELFQHTPAVFVLLNSDEWCSGRFYHLKDVCWNDPTMMFQRYKQLTNRADSPVQQPRVLAPFYSQLEGMRDFFTRVHYHPNMKQYVGLLELICSSSPIPTAEVRQDASVLYARLAHKCKIQIPADQESMSQPKLNPSYCSTLKGMVSDKRVFPTKDNNWVTLARKPMIADSKELEKIFKTHKEVCLLDLPSAEKKTAPRTKTERPAFREEDRDLFLEICGIQHLSDCVKTEPQTENFRPCVAMQAMVRSVVPYIQRFLYHHEDIGDLYSELIDNNIAEKILSFYVQVGKLYIRYQLDVADGEDAVVEVQDVICLLKDNKELYIQKDHLSAKLDICRFVCNGNRSNSPFVIRWIPNCLQTVFRYFNLSCCSGSAVPDAVMLPSTFQGTAAAAETHRPPLNLDFPFWNKVQPPQATLEDMELNCQRPTTVLLSDDQRDVAAIGEWGEQLVNSFLCHWRDSDDPGRPTQVLWCNQSGESGQPYDFKLTYGATDGRHRAVYVEVKSTVKKEKSFIHLSANELDFALKEKERYHIFRVYSAGDAQSVRLCRIQNLAQHLHTKDLALYLFV